MELLDVQPLETWMELEKAIVARSGMNANVFNPEGIRISDFRHWTNRLCPAIKDTEKGQSFICAVAHMNLAAMARQQRRTVIEECDAGFLKIVTPIFVEDLFIGAVGACGFLLEQGEVDSFMVERTTDISESEIERLAADTPVISMTAAEALQRFIETELQRLLGNGRRGKEE